MLRFIKVENLFGSFSYTVEFKHENSVTLIHGPNGSGKTTVLRMIKSLSERNFEIFFETPYDNVTLNINNAILVIENFGKESKLRITEGEHEFNVDKKLYESCNSFSCDKDTLNRELHKFGAIRLGPNRYEYNGKRYMGEDLYKMLIGGKEEFELPNWLDNILKDFNVQYISADRLGLNPLKPETKSATTVELDQSDLKRIFSEFETKYAIVSRNLDDTFPNRIIEMANSQNVQNLNENTLTERLSKLSALKDDFTDRGILVKKDTDNFLRKEISSDEIKDNETLKGFLQMFISDNEKKFEVFNTLIQNIKSFENIFEKVFDGKKVNVSSESGFHVSMVDGKMKGDVIPITKLSSGEQHYLVMFYELIFKTKKNDLILIDEPELSLHVSWQIDMVDQFIDIALNNDIKFIVATHSPSIIRNHKNLSVEVGYPNV